MMGHPINPWHIEALIKKYRERVKFLKGSRLYHSRDIRCTTEVAILESVIEDLEGLL